MSEQEFQQRISEDIGYIKGKVEDLCKKVDDINGDLTNAKIKITKHDLIIGKAGVIITAGVFVLATAFNLIVEFVKDKFFK